MNCSDPVKDAEASIADFDAALVVGKKAFFIFKLKCDQSLMFKAKINSNYSPQIFI